MPQFDTFSFLSQLFWLFSFFFLMLFFLNYYMLPVLSTILKVRNSAISFKFYLPWKASYTLSFLSCFLKINLISVFTLLGAGKDKKTCCVIISYFLFESLLRNIFLTKLFQKVLNAVLLCNN